MTEGGVVLADYDWDTLSRRDEVRLNAGAFKMDLLYEPDDDLASLVHTGPAPLTFDFIRNNSGQITILTASDGGFLSRPSAIQATGYVPNRLNQYASVGGTAYSHDANGNLSSDGTTGYEYDEENRLRGAVGGGITTSYEYDPLGRRRAKTVNGTLTKFVSDNAEEVEERDGSNAVLRRYIYGSGIDERIAMLDSACAGGRCYYLTNWQGSTTTLINQTGSTLNATYHYGPYGEGTNWSPSDALTGNPFRYTGRRVDPETGLYYYRARYYSPRLGRFLQTDPTGIEEDLNLFSYTYNDAINAIDPLGLAANSCTGSYVGAGCSFVKYVGEGPTAPRDSSRNSGHQVVATPAMTPLIAAGRPGLAIEPIIRPGTGSPTPGQTIVGQAVRQVIREKQDLAAANANRPPQLGPHPNPNWTATTRVPEPLPRMPRTMGEQPQLPHTGGGEIIRTIMRIIETLNNISSFFGLSPQSPSAGDELEPNSDSSDPCRGPDLSNCIA